MIIKRNLKSQMPSLKRVKLGDSVGENDECSYARKKRKTNNGYYPLNLLGDVAAGVIPVSFHGLLGAAGVVEKGFSAAWCNGVESNVKNEVVVEVKKKNEVQRPPLVRTSRGRVQVLPSRFNDSVIDNWRKESKSSGGLRDCDYDEEFECKKEKFSFKAPKVCNNNQKKGKSEEKTGSKARKYSALCNSFERSKCLSSPGDGSLALRHSGAAAVEEDDEKGRFLEVEKVGLMGLKEKRNGLFGPEDFYAGDIVWAKAGRKEPFWPAIVIDPMTQAPELVLRSCIADAACVMFLGYAGNENQRVCIM